MQRVSRDQLIRVALTAVILLSGLAMVPFIDLPAQAAITWQSLAGVYEPELEVNESLGMPGSVFAFTGSGYPPNTLATVYVDGQPLGMALIGGNGVGTFMVNTAGAAIGEYSVTLEVDINASATRGIELAETGPLVTPPPDFPGPTFNLVYELYLPLVTKP
ncbi:MAG TPA: hypothetical protein PLD25_23910 [Chloroflexota bacterium]|nr:hypothetical protein [Chloroflexota bacterium]HUM71662.1 hypothetical protein [Chloroflexota bacterium]